MNAPWHLLTLLSVLLSAEARCSPTSYYKNCWIRRFPGIYLDVEESLRRGAQLLKFYQEDTALKCSRTCCLTRNFSCNLAIFHYDATQDSVNCFHLHCPSLESCILSHKGNVVLYNITKGVDPDLLVFGKYFNTNVRVLPHHYSRSNASDPLPPDKRQFIHPRPRPVPPAPAPHQPVHTEDIPTTGQKPSSTEPPSVKLKSESASIRTRTDHAKHTTSNMATTMTHNSTTDLPHVMSTTTTTTPSYNQKPSTFQPPSPTFTLSPMTYLPLSTPGSATSTKTPPSSDHPSPTMPSDDPAADAEGSKHSTNDTKGSLGRNQSLVSEDGPGSGGGAGGGDPWAELGPGWHVATHTALVAVAICVTLLLGCCCSVVLVFSWRGHRKRMGRYRTAWRGRKGSMRLIKYVLVKENS